MQDSLSMVESWRKVIPGLSMIKLTPHRVSQIRFCALDTVAAAYSTLSRVQSHLSCWHHCIAITVSERETALGQRGGKRIKAMLSVCLRAYLSFSWSTNINQGPHHTNVGNLTSEVSLTCQSIKASHIYCTADFSMWNYLLLFFTFSTKNNNNLCFEFSIGCVLITISWIKRIKMNSYVFSCKHKPTVCMAALQKVFIFTVICGPPKD